MPNVRLCIHSFLVLVVLLLLVFLFTDVKQSPHLRLSLEFDIINKSLAYDNICLQEEVSESLE